MLSPFGHAAHHAAGATGGDDRLFEPERVPLRYRAPYRLTVLLTAENAQRGGAMVWEVGMDIAPAAVLGRVHAHHRIAVFPDFGAVHLQVMTAAQRGDCLAQTDRDLLAAPGAQFPQIRCGETSRCECRGPGRTDAERRRQHRVVAAGDLDGARPLF